MRRVYGAVSWAMVVDVVEVVLVVEVVVVVVETLTTSVPYVTSVFTMKEALVL